MYINITGSFIGRDSITNIIENPTVRAAILVIMYIIETFNTEIIVIGKLHILL